MGTSGALSPAPKPRLPHPPIPAPTLTIRRLLVGYRSWLFVGVMLLRLIWLIVEGTRTAQAPADLVVGGGIYLMAILIASPDRRVRAAALGVLCSLSWAYALTDAGEAPSASLPLWLLLLVPGALAAFAEMAYGRVTRRYATVRHALSPTEATRLIQTAMGLLAIGLLAAGMPVAIIGEYGARTNGLSGTGLIHLASFAFSQPPLIGGAIAAILGLKRIRALATARLTVLPPAVDDECETILQAQPAQPLATRRQQQAPGAWSGRRDL
ncbi:MAG: hypothetical protein IT305_13125 [Chloroflexi bacterium]|nr:hypothetical protein [Chloroflexota bacterium]